MSYGIKERNNYLIKFILVLVGNFLILILFFMFPFKTIKKEMIKSRYHNRKLEFLLLEFSLFGLLLISVFYFIKI